VPFNRYWNHARMERADNVRSFCYRINAVFGELLFKRNKIYKMKAQAGQIAQLEKHFSNINSENITILFEAGNDDGETFNGEFIAKIKGHGVFRVYENGSTKRIK